MSHLSLKFIKINLNERKNNHNQLFYIRIKKQPLTTFATFAIFVYITYRSRQATNAI